MNETQIKTSQNDLKSLAEDARLLITATTDVASQKFGEVRQRAAETVQGVKETAGCVRDQAVDYVKATDLAVHEHPYQALGIAFGVGALIGYLASRPRSRNDN